MIGAKVNVVGGWGQQFARAVNAEVKDAVQDASKVGAEVASDASRPRRRTGRMAEMEVFRVRGTPTGWEGGFGSKAFYAGMQSRGTKGGIRGLGFLEKGRAAAKKHLIERLNRIG